MARVELLIDPLRISRQPVDVEVQDQVEARAARQKIRSHLLEASADVIRVRMDTQAFRLLVDMEGLTDLRVIRVSARGELARKIHGTIPLWCTDEFIVSFSLLDKTSSPAPNQNSFDIDINILFLISPTLVVAETPEELLLALRNISAPIQQLFLSEAIKLHFQRILLAKLNLQDIAFVFQFLQADNFVSLIDSIFAEIAYEKIRTFVTRTKIALTIPARQIPLTLTSKLTLTSEWWNVLDMAKMTGSFTQRVVQCVEKGQLSANEIPSIILGYDKAQLSAIVTLLNTHPEFATVELLKGVRGLDCSDTIDIENAIESHLEVVPPCPLEIQSSAKEAMDWAKVYLNYAANSMKRSNEPDPVISKSFSDWVSAHPGRLNNSQWNWRAVSTSVQHALGEGKIVVLLVVDALGSILTKPLLDELYAVDEALHVEERVLFAPLPTITEIGKLAVAAGKDVHKLSGDAESVLRRIYADYLSSPNEFQFEKGWTLGTKIMTASTRFLVFFENQLDDQLHECLHYSDLDAQLKIVNSKIVKWVKQWIMEARSRNKDFEIFITADHGLTKVETIQEFAIEKGDGIVGERHIRVTKKNYLVPQGFYQISAEGAPESCYLIPHDRVRLLRRAQPFVHGGMTAEEILIPLISIRPLRDNDSRPIVVRLAQPLALLYSDGWSVQLILTAGVVPLQNIAIRAELPFDGELKVNALSANEAISSMLHLRATVPQEGDVAVGFSLRFLLPNATTYTVIELSLDISLQPRVLIRSQGEIDFDNMFD
jgi:hypothetical protein